MDKNLMKDYGHFVRHYVGEIHSNYRPNALKGDGGEYYGQITFCFEVDGIVNQVELFQASGHEEMDRGFLDAISNLDNQPIPEDPCFLNFTHYKKFTLYYDHNDLFN
jgi:hypothetical protein